MSFKKCKVVMLSTNEKAIDGQFCIGKYEEYALIDNIQMQNKLSCGTKVMDGDIKMSYKHLYITSDEEIKVGDWMYSQMDGYPTQWDGDLSESKNPKEYGYNKIISTTDKSITTPGYNSFDEDDICNCYLPQPSQQFIEKYIEEYNKGNVITDVLVEYIDNGEEGWSGSNEDGEPIWNEKIELKVNPKGNTITIKKVKDSWNREEVIELISDWTRMKSGLNINLPDNFDNWIETNL